MKALLTRRPFSDPAWIFERKLDGIRCIAVRREGAVQLLSRNDLQMNDRYPEIATALAGAGSGPDCALDGEVVAFQGSVTSFARLAERRRHPVAVYYYVFDLLWLAGQDLRALPLLTRKRLLRRLGLRDPLRLTPHRNADGQAAFRTACRKRWEGVVAKRLDSRYAATRSQNWLKLKCEQGQELVIGGFTAPRGSRTEFGALLLGYYESGALRYAGKVGTGFDTATLHELGALLGRLRTPSASFADAAAIRERNVSWVRPELVAQVAFTEWTGHGRLRHPRFLGLRQDKSASKVVRER